MVIMIENVLSSHFYIHVLNLTLGMLGTTLGSTCGTFPVISPGKSPFVIMNCKNI
jgi:hypothetical protein